MVINLVNRNTAVQSPFFDVEELYLSKTLYLRGKASHLAVLTFNNSPITRLVALKCGFVRELVISVTLNIVRQATANVCFLCELVDLAGTNSTLQSRWARGGVTYTKYWKQELSKQTVPQSNSNRNTVHLIHTEHRLTQEKWIQRL